MIGRAPASPPRSGGLQPAHTTLPAGGHQPGEEGAPGGPGESTADLTATLCAVLRGDALDLPSGEAGERLFDLARSHRVDRLVAHLSGRGPGPFPRPDWAPVLIDDVSVRELTRVLAALESVGTQPLVFKGAALAHTHYAESWLRPRLDTDILVAPDRRRPAFDALRELGYERPAFVSGDLVMYQEMLVRTDRAGLEHVVDLHWRIANPQVIARVLTHEELLTRATAVSAGGYAMRVPSAVDALVLACLHRAAHHDDSGSLLWIYDIHLIAGRLTPDEWSRFVHLASSRSVKALCVRGLQLSRTYFETRIPADVVARLTPESRSRPELSAVYLSRNLRLIDRLRVDLRDLGPRAGAHLVWEHLFPPADYMERAYGVRNRALLPVYYASRVLMGASKWFGRPGPTNCT